MPWRVTNERKMKGVFGVNAASGGYKQADRNRKTDIDEYKARIDSRIADIKKNCKVAEPGSPAMQSN